MWVPGVGEVYDWMSGPKYWPEVIDNLWLGVTAENQEQADKRIPILLEIPAAVRFVSVEPMHGPVNLSSLWDVCPECGSWEIYEPRGEMRYCDDCGSDVPTPKVGIDWVIVGGESGPGARPMHPDWSRSLRDQCQAAGVPFFFKQWGEWWPLGQRSNSWDGNMDHVPPETKLGEQLMIKVGKKKAGRLLDGKEWLQYPGVS